MHRTGHFPIEKLCKVYDVKDIERAITETKDSRERNMPYQLAWTIISTSYLPFSHTTICQSPPSNRGKNEFLSALGRIGRTAFVDTTLSL